MEETDEWEEEQLVLVELAGLLEQEVLFKASTEHCRLLGIDTSEPVLQIGPYTFVGHNEDVIGTHVIFEETTSSNNEKKQYKFKGSTNKCLKMGRAFLLEKTSEEPVLDDSEQSSSSGSSSNSDDDDSDGDKKDGDDDDNDENNVHGEGDDIENNDEDQGDDSMIIGDG